MFLLAVVALCFGTAYLTSLAGVSVSLGAFLAGLVVSESRQAEQAFSEVLPLQILFSAVFFLSVGMLLDVRFLLEEPLLVLGGIAVALVVKAVVAAGAARLLGVPAAAAVAAGLMLAQVGEFSFVLAQVGTEADLSPAGLGEDGQQAFIAATVLLMVATPGLAALGERLGARVEARRQRRGLDAAASPGETAGSDVGAPVALLGFGDGARELVRVLRELDVPVVVTTLDPDGAQEAERLGARVVSGDATRAHVLEAAEIDQASVVVVADDDPETTDRVLAAARRVAPRARLVARPQGEVDLDGLVELGAHVVVDAERASTRRLVSAVLRRTRAADVSPRVDTGEDGGRTVVDTEAVVRRHVRDDDRVPARGAAAPGARQRARLRGLPAARPGRLGPPAGLPDLRARRLLRLLPAAPRPGARRGPPAPGHDHRRAGRGLGLLLPRPPDHGGRPRRRRAAGPAPAAGVSRAGDDPGAGGRRGRRTVPA